MDDDDLQAPRLSYVCNEVIMPRKKGTAAYDAANPPTSTAGLQLVTTDAIDHTNLTILTGEFTQVVNDIQVLWSAAARPSRVTVPPTPSSAI